MSDVQNPWEDSDGQNSAANSQGDAIRVVQFQKSKTADDSFNRNGFNWGWIIVALILVWLASGFYQIQTNEQGVVLRFGKYSQTTDAGLHYHLPYPIEDVIKVSMTQERSINLGEAAAYNALEGLRYLSLVGIVGGVALGSATMTMGTLDLFESEKQKNTFTISTVVVLGVSILLGVTTHVAAKRQYDHLLLSAYDYYDYMENNSQYFKGDLR